MSYLSETGTSNRKVTAFGIAVIVHIAIIYALVTGLASDAYKKMVQATQAVEIKQEKPPEEPPPPPPEKLQDIPVVTPPPDVVVQQQSNAPPPITTTTSIPVYTAPVQVVHEAPPAPPPPPVEKKAEVPASAASPRGSPKSWFSDEDYPDEARRLNEEGTTVVALAINEQGRIEGCNVTKSSGSRTLDARTCQLFPRRGRFNAAKAEGGAPMKSTLSYPVTWRLPKE